MMVARTKPAQTLRVVFSRRNGEIESAIAVDGADARDQALIILSRFDELADGDRLSVIREFR